MSADLYQYRPPIDLTNRRLRAMAGALGPAYVRISGTWANTTYFADTRYAAKRPAEGLWRRAHAAAVVGGDRFLARCGRTDCHLAAEQ